MQRAYAQEIENTLTARSQNLLLKYRLVKLIFNIYINLAIGLDC